MTLEQFRTLIQKLADKEGQNVLARRLGVSNAYVSDIVNGRRDPGQKILEGLGYRRVISYERSE